MLDIPQDLVHMLVAVYLPNGDIALCGSRPIYLLRRHHDPAESGAAPAAAQLVVTRASSAADGSVTIGRQPCD